MGVPAEGGGALRWVRVDVTRAAAWVCHGEGEETGCVTAAPEGEGCPVVTPHCGDNMGVACRPGLAALANVHLTH